MMASRLSLLLIGIAVVLTAMPALAQEAPPPGAQACGGCHPANNKGPVVSLSGLPAAGVVEAMQAFRSGARPATVMDRIAKGFTDDETRAIAAFYARQVRP